MEKLEEESKRCGETLISCSADRGSSVATLVSTTRPLLLLLLHLLLKRLLRAGPSVRRPTSESHAGLWNALLLPLIRELHPPPP